jgi:hypothetical protein
VSLLADGSYCPTPHKYNHITGARIGVLQFVFLSLWHCLAGVCTEKRRRFKNGEVEYEEKIISSFVTES